MTKRDFIAFAAKLKACMPVYEGDKDNIDYLYHGFQYSQWVQCVRAVLEVCEASNPKFSKGKFIAACGVPNLLDK